MGYLAIILGPTGGGAATLPYILAVEEKGYLPQNVNFMTYLYYPSYWFSFTSFYTYGYFCG